MRDDTRRASPAPATSLEIAPKRDTWITIWRFGEVVPGTKWRRVKSSRRKTTGDRSRPRARARALARVLSDRPNSPRSKRHAWTKDTEIANGRRFTREIRVPFRLPRRRRRRRVPLSLQNIRHLVKPPAARHVTRTSRAILPETRAVSIAHD